MLLAIAETEREDKLALIERDRTTAIAGFKNRDQKTSLDYHCNGLYVCCFAMSSLQDIFTNVDVTTKILSYSKIKGRELGGGVSEC